MEWDRLDKKIEVVGHLDLDTIKESRRSDLIKLTLS